MNSKQLFATFLVTFIAILPMIVTIPLLTAASGTNVTGIIDTNRTWTKSASPYMLTGPILVKQGITLTIEQGAIVNLDKYYILINGTLNARGTKNENIQFTGGSGGQPGAITFTKYSESWNEETSKGSIIENTVITCSSIAVNIGDTSPKINNNTITGAIWTADSDAVKSLTASSPIITITFLSKATMVSYFKLTPHPLLQTTELKAISAQVLAQF